MPVVSDSNKELSFHNVNGYVKFFCSQELASNDDGEAIPDKVFSALHDVILPTVKHVKFVSCSEHDVTNGVVFVVDILIDGFINGRLDNVSCHAYVSFDKDGGIFSTEASSVADEPALVHLFHGDVIL